MSTVAAPAAGELPVFDLTPFFNAEGELEVSEAHRAEFEAACAGVARALHQYGLLMIKDPRVRPEQNEEFLDMMEKYFGQERAALEPDIRPEVHYQVGATPGGTEKARDHCARAAQYAEEDRPVTICPPGVDPKWRFFWRIGPRPEYTAYAKLNAEDVVPAAFPQWREVMNAWGTRMIEGVRVVARMAALGFELPEHTFASLLDFGPHLLAPTGSSLAEHGDKGTVFANLHYDLNFLTIHGKSRFPGLYAWTRDGKKFPVRVPDGYLLLQAGKQFEYLTGGEVVAGFHEVVVNDATLAAIEKARAENRSLWRISSTLFSHVASDHTLRPIEKFATPERNAQYPPVTAGQQVSDELAAIKLGASK